MARISANLAHDMRMPLQLIYSCAQMIETELNDPEQPASRYARLLMENVQSLRDMVASELNRTTGCADIVHTVSGLCRRMDAEAKPRGITLLFSSNTASLQARIDPSKLCRILQNLIANALRFTPEGGHVRVDLRAMGDSVEITVSDTGSGIDPRRQKKIFEPGESQDSFGLGLGIVRKLIRQMGGHIEVESRPGKGAAFILRIPIGRRA